MNKKLTYVLTLTFLSTISYNQAVLSATATTSFPVTATVIPSCILNAGDLNFESYTGATKESTNTISLRCTSGLSFAVGLDAGKGPGASTDKRVMTYKGGNSGQENRLNYTIYRNSTRTIVWGDVNTPGSISITAAQSAAANGKFNFTGYGRIFPDQAPTPSVDNFSIYTDTITVTVSY